MTYKLLILNSIHKGHCFREAEVVGSNPVSPTKIPLIIRYLWFHVKLYLSACRKTAVVSVKVKSQVTLLLSPLIGVILAGCGSQSGSNAEPTATPPLIEWSGNITEQSEEFIVSYDRSVIQGPIMEDILRWWETTQFCVGVEIEVTTPIVIEYTPLKDLPEGHNGWHVAEDSYIRVFDGDDGLITLHEMTHELLSVIGVNEQYNDNHGGFHRCFGDGTF